MNPVQIQWSLANAESLQSEVYAHVFMLEGNSGPLYIGDCFRQPLDQCIGEAIGRIGVNTGSLKVWLGRIKDAGAIKVNRNLTRGIVKLNVYGAKPLFNAEGKRHYQGPEALSVINMGCPLLSPGIRAEGNLVFRSMRIPGQHDAPFTSAGARFARR